MQKFIKPARAGLLVRDHQSKLRPLPAEGKSVDWDVTWARRLRDGDIVIVAKPEPRKEAAKQSAPDKNGSSKSKT